MSDQIQQALTSAAKIKEIRLVKNAWSGESKGCGYADFENKHDSQQVLKLVAINPLQKQQKASSVSASLSLGASEKSSGPRGKGPSQIALIPRKLTTKTTMTTVNPHANNVITGIATTTVFTLKNDDFRKIFIKK
ncbi:unnamed protein product [Didymodactylos carnosus]|uniref:RRM domain-containing protein n=1 Tax=Didymodactylos carnosus TaxID=1234261 RepID=A0A813WRQ1_9BILA|nr:unnamed protein product [Didymodactylos carnosus]CAF1020673.1 unnamed protein product [Didymodactylos carnosus]CAF3642777.1 unnamed protein product [Didymodactylos carnosus]CAF3789387.1 unnamed protein product [Didymodactylos carnosus]